MNNAVPSEAEVETPARHLRLLKAVGRTHLRAEHFKQCLQEAHPGENSKTPPADGALDFPGGHLPTHVANGLYPTGFGEEYPGNCT